MCFLLVPRDIPVMDVRMSYFILPNPFSSAEEFIRAASAGQDAVWKRETQIGRFAIVHSTSVQILCRLVSGTMDELDGSCYVRLAEQSGQKQEAKPQPSRLSPSIPLKPSPVPLPAEPELHAADLVFKRIGDSLVSEKPLSFSSFQTLENLNALLTRLEAATGNAYRFSIPSDRLIQEQASHFRSAWRDGFYLCLVSGRIGYCHVTGDGAIAFKTVSVATLLAMADKFQFQVVAKKNE